MNQDNLLGHTSVSQFVADYLEPQKLALPMMSCELDKHDLIII